MLQQSINVLTTQRTKQMYDDEDKEWFMNILVHENVSFTIIENEQYWITHCGYKPKNFHNLQPKVSYLSMTQSMQIIFNDNPILNK